jgi:hypothetical protein
VKLALGGRAGGGFLLASRGRFGFRRFDLFHRGREIGELLLNRLRLFLFRLEFSANRVQLRARIFQRDRKRFFLPDDVGQLRAQRVGNFSRLG